MHRTKLQFADDFGLYIFSLCITIDRCSGCLVWLSASAFQMVGTQIGRACLKSRFFVKLELLIPQPRIQKCVQSLIIYKKINSLNVSLWIKCIFLLVHFFRPNDYFQELWFCIFNVNIQYCTSWRIRESIECHFNRVFWHDMWYL